MHNEMTEFYRLDTAYRRAWQEFVVSVDLHRLGHTDAARAPEAVVALERAECTYRIRRNELANYLLLKRREVQGARPQVGAAA